MTTATPVLLIYCSFPVCSPHNFTPPFYRNPLSSITTVHVRAGVGHLLDRENLSLKRTILPPPAATTWQQFLHWGRHLEDTSTEDEVTASSVVKEFPAAKHTCCVHIRAQVCGDCLSVSDLVEPRGWCCLCRSIVLQLIFFS